ncbi:YegS/Rv2252/BmrU family lipid kinase [Anaerotaenia torta]|uniref:diacylglycerol/lipid kinase family protein n=1 Tax=Anaerotaenia torta TaxID=433293 RepID=UPI003D22EE8A
MKKILFVFNPAAGRGRLKSKLFDIVDSFIKNGYRVQVYPTQQKGDATSIILNEPDPYDVLVCAGGDGTLNEVITGMMLADKSVPIGLIPAGSMNDVGHSFKISRNIMNAVNDVMTGRPYSMDIGCFNGKYFIYVAAFGAFTDISYTTPQKNKNIIGNLAYYLEGIRKLSELKPRLIRVEYGDQVIEEEFLIGLVTNSLYIGGFKNPSYDKTSLNDGLMEVLLIKMPKNIFELEMIVSSLINYRINESLMYYIQAPSLTITSEKMEWTLDGEFGGSHERVEISNCSRAIKIINKSLHDNA